MILKSDLPLVRPVPSNNELLTFELRNVPAEADLAFQQAQKFRQDGDLMMALQSYRCGAELNHLEAQHQFAEWCMIGLGLYHRDMDMAGHWYKKAADQGYTSSMCALGDFYKYGLGPCNRDMTRATELYRKAAELGHVDAQTRLGFMLMHQYEVRWDYEEAVQWWKKAADKKSALAHSLLAECHLLGLGVKQDKAEAEMLAKVAAELGNPDAQFNMGIICEMRWDFVSARYWYEQASKQGCAWAKTHLGDFHWHGVGGLSEDKNEAVVWYCQAAGQGDLEAIKRLAYCYTKGIGVKHDKYLGEELANIAGTAHFGAGTPSRLEDKDALGCQQTPTISHIPEYLRNTIQHLWNGTQNEVNLSSVYISPEAARGLVMAGATSVILRCKSVLGRDSQVTAYHFAFEVCNLVDTGIKALASAMKVSTTVTSLYLGGECTTELELMELGRSPTPSKSTPHSPNCMYGTMVLEMMVLGQLLRPSKSTRHSLN
ncbi:HCP-like protein [Gonapodya prolifera JEL478]|uniref:HCP-like protein n=1 Tax=Gonapodya prolifera (strain JEL478) TaxID=1344416 RepID=A0A139A2B6_GONPJ|nr:HCP-like protein [Gonapodya prolifera JEL478]|eukprot:KXS10839.1 HCP-like protein [Gonapodya prolifera JEL478]